MNSTIEKYYIRRKKRLLNRMDEDDGGKWVTTEEGHKIHISDDGVVDKGNPHVICGMGKPKGAKLTYGTIQLKESEIKIPKKLDDGMVEAIKNRKDKECIFGGYYRVKEDSFHKSTSVEETFFNPYTGEHFSIKTGDYSDRVREEDYGDWPGKKEISSIPINQDVQNLWDRANGRIHVGASVVVKKGRTLPVGTKGKVVSIVPVHTKYGTEVADYALLDTGEKINVNNLAYEDEYTPKGDKSGKSFSDVSDVGKADYIGGKLSKKFIDKECVSSVIKGAKTSADVEKALKRAGYNWKKTSYADGFDIHIDRPNGEYVRIYQKGTGRKTEFVVQDWTKVKKEIRSDEEISDAKKSMAEFISKKMGKSSTRNLEFSKMKTEQEKLRYVMLKTYIFTKYTIGLSDKEAISRAISNAEYAQKDGYDGFRDSIMKLGK